MVYMELWRLKVNFDIFEIISNGEEIAISEDHAWVCCRAWSCSAQFTNRLALRWVLKGWEAILAWAWWNTILLWPANSATELIWETLLLNKQTNQPAKTKQVKRILKFWSEICPKQGCRHVWDKDTNCRARAFLSITLQFCSSLHPLWGSLFALHAPKARPSYSLRQNLASLHK